MEVCEFKDYAGVADRFGMLFGVRLSHFIDNMRSAIVTGRVTIDLYKLDSWLHEKHGNYEESGLSMQELIIREYGEEANEIIKKLI